MQENESGQILGDILAVSGRRERTTENILVKTGSVLVGDQNVRLTNGGQKCHSLVHRLGSCVCLPYTVELHLPGLTFKRRIKSHLPFAGIIRSSPYSPRFQDNG